MPAKYYKGVEWLEPFVKASKGLVPVDKVVIVRGFRVPFSVGTDITGATCTTYDEHKTYTIAVRTHNQIMQINANGTFSPKIHKARFIYDILGDLAHELAHMVEWEHTPEHWLLECKIQRRFIIELCKRGVTEVATRRVKDITG